MRNKKRGGLKAKPCTLNRSTPHTIASLCDKWLAYLERKNYSMNTVDAYWRGMKRFLKWVDDHGFTTAQEVTKKVLESYQKHLHNIRQANGEPLAVSTVSKELCSIRKFFQHLCITDHIDADPSVILELPRKPRKKLPKHFTKEQMQDIRNQPDLTSIVGYRNKVIIEVAYATGARREELAELQVDCYDRQSKKLLINRGKGDKERVVPLSATACHYLNKYIDEVREEFVVDSNEKALFLTGYGEGFSKVYLGNMIGKIIKKAGVNGSIHGIRHTTATRLVENGCGISIVAQLLGHEDLSTTQIYTKVAITTLQDHYNQFFPED